MRDVTPVFDLALEDWIVVSATAFFFEPWGSQFEPGVKGDLVVRFGSTTTRHRGIELSVLSDGWVSVWLPEGARTYWLPEAAREADVPWGTKLQALEFETGTLNAS
jgi:hypothetical protein